jgi:hypothetical protein
MTYLVDVQTGMTSEAEADDIFAPHGFYSGAGVLRTGMAQGSAGVASNIVRGGAPRPGRAGGEGWDANRGRE